MPIEQTSGWSWLKVAAPASTKHALLAALAIEQGLAVQLTLGISEMTARNTPGVGRVLSRHGLAFVPEAHCYLIHSGVRIDVTRDSAVAQEPIAPEQIGEYKSLDAQGLDARLGGARNAPL